MPTIALLYSKTMNEDAHWRNQHSSTALASQTTEGADHASACPLPPGRYRKWEAAPLKETRHM